MIKTLKFRIKVADEVKIAGYGGIELIPARHQPPSVALQPSRELAEQGGELRFAKIVRHDLHRFNPPISFNLHFPRVEICSSPGTGIFLPELNTIPDEFYLTVRISTLPIRKEINFLIYK